MHLDMEDDGSFHFIKVVQYCFNTGNFNYYGINISVMELYSDFQVQDSTANGVHLLYLINVTCL